MQLLLNRQSDSLPGEYLQQLSGFNKEEIEQMVLEMNDVLAGGVKHGPVCGVSTFPHNAFTVTYFQRISGLTLGLPRPLWACSHFLHHNQINDLIQITSSL